ncbi:type III secretion system needle tip complex Bsp22 [Melaminivora jejuensis]|uniref:hypothetical protein n=1 Tax=Melaminivora jejuensis TaxID=1267217 RepID=UPI001AE0003D|nr:hypothetical protein [Melaminivora jejuensis]UHJ66033.1 hypothetical protein LVC68_05825 [Melaminivora jejuensis]
MSAINPTAIAGMSSIDVQSMDLETLMMMVQSNRAQLLEDQLKSQISSVQAKNDNISKLNELLGALNSAAAKFKSDAKAGDTIAIPADIKTTAASAGITLPSGFSGDKVTKGNLDSFVQQTKSMIDSQSNSQQMDMLRLQSLSNKRNEAFETMTNFIKKMQDSRNSIISNMR